MKLLKKYNNNNDVKRVVENFFSLSALTFISYGFPLVLIPYLTRTLGVEKYGVYAFAFAIINYFTIIVKYGFEFSATKQVAIVRDDKDKLSLLFSSVLSVRMLLMLLAMLALFLGTLLVPKFHEEQRLLLYGLGISVGVGLIPAWFFQGMENMKFMTIINFVTRLCSTLLIFIFVKSELDYELAILFQSIGFIVGGAVSVVLAYSMFDIKFMLPKRKDMIFQLKDGWQLFLSTIGMNFYRETNVIILGFVTDYTIVGYYSSGEKIIKAVQSLVSPVARALFPFFGRKMNVGDNTAKHRKTFMKGGKYYGGLLAIISVAIFLLAPWGITLYLGDDYLKSIVDVQILSSLVFLGGLNYYYGIVGLVNFGKEKAFTRSVWVAGILSLFICYFLALKFNDIGASIAMVIAELVLLVQILVELKKENNE